MASEALASLTATYTDSEGEEEGSPAPPAPSARSPAPDSPRRPARLVSYVDDTVVSEEEAAAAEEAEDAAEAAAEAEDALLPPEPAGRCPRELQELVSKYYQRVQHEGLDMNKLIQDKKNFRNPSIYEKLIQFCDINELDTNYPPALYDPLRWGNESFHDQLAKVQKAEMDRREKEKKEKNILFSGAASAKRTESDEEKKRKSKWDQAAPNAMPKPSLTQPGLLPLAAKTSITTIPAFGAIAKKPRL